MPKHSLQPDLDLPSSERPCELMAADLAPHQPCIAIPARPEVLQRLLGASIDENRHLTAHVRRLEADARRNSAELARLRGELRDAVHDALTDPLTGLGNRRLFDRELAAAAGAREHLVTHPSGDG